MSSSAVLVHDDGTMTLLTGTSDMGQGSETAFSQILNEEMGVEPKDISVTVGILPAPVSRFVCQSGLCWW